MDTEFPSLAVEGQQQPASMAFNFSRRYACDRCRGQKLRCNRDLMSLADSPCLRCRKAKAKCTIASASPRKVSGPGPVRGRSWSVSKGAENTSIIPGGLLPLRASHYFLLIGVLEESYIEPARDADHAAANMSSRPSLNESNLIQPPRHSSWGTAPDIQSPGDISRFDSISWHDMFSSTFEEAQEVDTRRVAATLPTPLSPLFNQPATYPIATQEPAAVALTDADYSAPPVETRTRLGEPLITTVTPQVVPQPTQDEGSNVFPSLCSDQITIEGHDIQPLVALKDKDKNIEILSELSATLQKDLHRIIAYSTASSFLFTHSDSTAAQYFFKTMDCTTSSDYIIGKMLHGSEAFLEIVQSLNQPPPTQHYPDSEQSADGENGNSSGSEEINDSSETGLEAQMEERWKLIQTVLSRAAYSAGNSTTGNRSGGSLGRMHQPKRDVPSILVLVTCYTCLIKIYESVFSILHQSFEVSRKFPQTITGLQINNFVLQNHGDLQVKILIQVSTYMLDSIEKALGGLLSDPLFQALLKISLQQEGYDSLGRNESSTSIVREKMKKIEDLFLNNNS